MSKYNQHPKKTSFSQKKLVQNNHSLKILLITTFYPPYSFGGDGNYVRMFAHALIRAGHKVDVIYDADAFRALSSDPEPKAIDEPDGLHVHQLKSRWPTLACLATQQTSHPLVHGKEIRRIIDAGNFDIIHYHNISLVGGLGILAYGDAIKIYTAHEHWLVCPTHVLWQHNQKVCQKRECIRCQFNYKRPLQLWRWTNLLNNKVNHVDAFCALSQFSAEQHYKFGFPNKMKVLPSFLPNSFESAPEEKIAKPLADSKTPYFLFVGRLEKIKGLQDVIPYFGSDAPAEFWIAGTGLYENELKNIAATFGKVKFLGQKKPGELKYLYANALALIAPSICYEVFPLVLLEAFRESIPVIARALGPYPEIVKQSNAGLLFNTADELKSAILSLVKNHKLRNKMGEAGQIAFRKYWCEQAAMINYFQLIQDLAINKQLTEITEISSNTLQHLKEPQSIK